jgi:hypothetical protein
MTALLGKAGKQLFERHLEQYAPVDPVYEYWTDERGKKQKRKVSVSILHNTVLMGTDTEGATAWLIQTRCKDSEVGQKACT